MPLSGQLHPSQSLDWNGTVVSVWEDRTYEPRSQQVLQDLRIGGRLVWRRKLAEFPRAMEVTVVPIDAHHLRCTVVESGMPPYSREVILTVNQTRL